MSAGKVIVNLIIFCDIKGVILNHFVPPKTTVTGHYYANVIKYERFFYLFDLILYVSSTMFQL